MGILYEPLRETALTEALTDIRSGFDLKRASQKAYAKALTLDWKSIGKQLTDVYEYVLTL
jgi:hypothetical protein